MRLSASKPSVHSSPNLLPVGSLEQLAEFIKGQVLSKGESSGEVTIFSNTFYNRKYHFAGREYGEHAEVSDENFVEIGIKNVRFCLSGYQVKTVFQTGNCAKLRITRALEQLTAES